MKARSIFWNFFTHVGEKRLRCNHCYMTISISGGSVGNLGRHIKKKHPELLPIPKAASNNGDQNSNTSNVGELNEFIVIDVKDSAEPQQPQPLKRFRFNDSMRSHNDNCHACCRKKGSIKENYYKKKLELLEKKVQLLETNVINQEKGLELQERIATALESLCS